MKLQYYTTVSMFVLFSMAFSFIKNSSFRLNKFIKVDR